MFKELYYNQDMHEEITAVYDMLWNSSFNAVSRGEVDIDPYITNPGSDQRRGLTLIFRPAAELQTTILGFLEELQSLEPDQYYYNATNLHFTVLSLFTAIPDYQPEYDRLAAYEAVVTQSVADVRPFSLHICGLTVSRSAVMLCGFPDSESLNVLRQHIRQGLKQSGLAHGLDKRYTLTAAHTTVLRFSAALRDAKVFSEFLLENKQRDFGAFKVSDLQLVKNDWYMSQQHTPIIMRYALKKC
jgi:2'-5' RNA ligase